MFFFNSETISSSSLFHLHALTHPVYEHMFFAQYES